MWLQVFCAIMHKRIWWKVGPMTEDKKLSERKAVVDQQIQDAMNAGKFANLPGAGKPLKLDQEDPNDPYRMAHKLLKDNDLAPAWIMDGKELETTLSKLRKALRKAAEAYRQGGPQAETRWAQARHTFVEAAVVYNRKVLSFNLKAPPGVAHRYALDVERELAKALDSQA